MLGRTLKGGLDLALLPAKTVMKATGLGGKHAPDRVDAAVSDLAGSVTGDRELQERAERKRMAADARETAERERADAQRTAAKKKSATRQATQKTVERADERADRMRREALDERAEALEEKERALRADATADQLSKAASRTKAARKA